MNLVTVFSTFNAAEAHVIRARLETAQFHPVLTNEIAALMLPIYSSTGTIRVQVPEDEAENARELLAAGGDAADDHPPAT